MKRAMVLLFILIFFSSSCSINDLFGNNSREEKPPIQVSENRCGDGFCGEAEDDEKCPEDCASETLPERQSPVLFLGIMVHLEGWGDQFDEAKFNRHVQLMRDYAELFESYGAKLTWESKEVTEGILKWGDNVLLEMEQRGHGIGVHADIGGQKTYDCSSFNRELENEKKQLELLGVTVRHVSGNVSHCDWVTATVEAGYTFTTGQVAYSVMSMPIENRPVEFQNCPNPSSCHDTFPSALEDRIHPWRMNSGVDWLEHDPNGKLVMLPSSGGLACMEEEFTDQKPCGDYTQADLDYFFQELDQAIALAKVDEVNMYYNSWSLGSPLDIDLMEAWLQRLIPYIESGQVEWKTLPEMYDTYVEWEGGQ